MNAHAVSEVVRASNFPSQLQVMPTWTRKTKPNIAKNTPNTKATRGSGKRKLEQDADHLELPLK